MLLVLVLLASTDIFDTEETRNYEVILRDLEDLRARPIDINTARLEELMRLPFLKISDGLKLIAVRTQRGYFSSAEDLQNSMALDPITVAQIKPYIVFRAKPVRFEHFHGRFRFRRDPGSGGSEEFYTRTQAAARDYTGFWVQEQDPYEPSFFDYSAGGIVVGHEQRKFAIGKYDLDFGSGVMLSSVGSVYQATDFRVISNERGIIPFTSVMENAGFFGAALSDTFFGKYTLFYSNQKLDGRVDTLGRAWSFYDGDHADSAAQAKKDKITEEAMGYDLKFGAPDFTFASRSYVGNYTPAFVATDSLNDFHGTRHWMSGASVKYRREKVVLFSEAARADRNRLGGLFGLSGILPADVELNLAGKYFPSGYFSPKGVEAGADHLDLTVDLTQHTKIARLGVNLNVASRLEEDSTDYDFRLAFEKKIGIVSSRIHLRAQFRERTQQLSGAKIFLRFEPAAWLYCDIRAEDKYFRGDSLERGIFAAIESGIAAGPVALKARYGIFDTDSYAARIYAYEPDLPGIVNNRLLYDQGNYVFAALGLRLFAGVVINAKYSVLNKRSPDRTAGVQIDLRI